MLIPRAGRRVFVHPGIGLRSSARDFLSSAVAPAATSMRNGAGADLQDCPVIVGAARTAFGSFQGALSSMTAVQLGSAAIKGALERARIPAQDVQEILMGNVVSAGIGQAPARQAALGAGLPSSTVCTTVNKVCASGMKAVMLGAQSIQLGLHDIVVAGGCESMSNIPHYLPGARKGLRMGHLQLKDGMILDGLWDPYNDVHMGTCADRCAQEHRISRAEQDAHAIESHRRAQRAHEAGFSGREIVPVELPARKGHPPTVVDRDEAPSKFRQDKLQQLRPAFSDGAEPGTVTAGNASPITDGAAALVLTSAFTAQQRGLKVLARIRGYADAEHAPEQFPTAPAVAVPKALQAAGLSLADMEYYEINEAFSVVDLVNQKLLRLDRARLNAHGGAVAIGHPIGASGAALLIRLMSVLEANSATLGVAAICNGGGGASAVILERC